MHGKGRTPLSQRQLPYTHPTPNILTISDPMRAANIFIGTLHVVVALVFILLGTVMFLLPWAADFRQSLIDFLTHQPQSLMLISVGFFLVGVVLLLTVIRRRSRYYYVRTGDRSVAVDVAAVRQLLNTFWKQMFRSHEPATDVVLKHNRLQITAHLPSCPFDQQKEVVRKIERDLAAALKNQLGYHDELLLSVSFQK